MRNDTLYGNSETQVLNIIPQLNDSIDDPTLAARLVALYSFMQGRELVARMSAKKQALCAG